MREAEEEKGSSCFLVRRLSEDFMGALVFALLQVPPSYCWGQHKTKVRI